jgi:hypothetical protein
LSPLGSNALTGLARALIGNPVASIAKRTALGQLVVSLLPALFIVAVLGITYRIATAPEVEASTAGLIEAGGLVAAPAAERELSTGLIGQAPAEEEEPAAKEGTPEITKQAPPSEAKTETSAKGPRAGPKAAALETRAAARLRNGSPRPVGCGSWSPWASLLSAVIYWLWSWGGSRFKMLLTSFFLGC